MKVKVGAVTVSYRGKLTFEEIDADRRYVRMVGKGREKTGSGSVTMTMEGRVLALDDGGSEVTVDSEVRLTGKIVRFGRGMIESISAEVFKEFRVRFAAKLSQEGQGNAADAADGMAGGDGSTAGADGSAAGADGGRADGGASTGAAPADSDDTLNLLPLVGPPLIRPPLRDSCEGIAHGAAERAAPLGPPRAPRGSPSCARGGSRRHGEASPGCPVLAAGSRRSAAAG